MEFQASQRNAVAFHNIPAGKLRRYIDWRNITDIFKTLFGIIKAFFVLGKLKPDLVFSKGGFVSFPVVVAAYLRKVPVIAHESDVIPGLTTKLCLPFVTKQCLGFETSKKYLTKWSQKLIYTGIPLRDNILHGSRQKGRSYLHISDNSRQILLVLGGSLGSKRINEAISAALPQLITSYTVVHMTGQGKETDHHADHYLSYSFFKDELSDVYQAADIIISRAGATTLAELLSLNKRVILIPLGKDQSRGDQIINAQTVEHLPNIRVIAEDKLNTQSLLHELQDLKNTPSDYQVPKEYSHTQATENVLKVIREIEILKPDLSN